VYERSIVAGLHRLGTQSPRDAREIGMLPLPEGTRQCPLGTFQARDMGVVSEKETPAQSRQNTKAAQRQKEH
jgi:hypothetical protein